MNYSVEQYKTFMRETGLFDMLSNHLVNNLVDYVLGIETGLDSNGRKEPRWAFDGKFGRKVHKSSGIYQG